MAGIVQQNVATLNATAQNSGNIAIDIRDVAQRLVGYAADLAREWRGQGATACAVVMENQGRTLSGLIRNLDGIAEVLKQSGAGFGAQEETAATNINRAGQHFLTGAINA